MASALRGHVSTQARYNQGMWSIIIAIIALTVMLVTGPFWWHWNRLERQAIRLLNSRDAFPLCELIAPLGQAVDRNHAEAVLLRLAEEMRIDPLRLRLEDRFDGILRGVFFNPNGNSDDFDETFMDECDNYGRDYDDGQNIHTIEDYIRFFASS